VRDDIERQRKNDESRQHAEHHGEPWSIDELDQLCTNWDGTDETLEVIAFVLGRTIEGCRQRYYEHQNGTPVTEVVEKAIRVRRMVPQRGWFFGYCAACKTTKDVHMVVGVMLCEECEEEMDQR
jgi:hypothetical protein